MNLVMNQPNCRSCRHFYVTWDPKRPYGCRAMQFKSKILPAIEVYNTDGSPCLSFQAKSTRPEHKNLADDGVLFGRNLDIDA